MYFNKAQVGIISQSVAQLLLRKLGAFFDRYRRWVASLLLIEVLQIPEITLILEMKPGDTPIF